MARTAKTPEATRPPPRLRRAYYDCRYGQLHLHNAIPSGGGFDELTSVLCVHGSQETARAFVPVLGALGLNVPFMRRICPDLANLIRQRDNLQVDAGVNALADFLDSMRIRSVDLVARGDGAEIAQRLAGLRGARVCGGWWCCRAADATSADLPRKLLAALGGTQPT